MRIGLNCFNINHCAGPCDSKTEESPDRPFLKPNSGGRYSKFTWKTSNGVYVDVYSVRMCRACCHRYMEMQDGVDSHDFESIERMHNDANAVMKKLSMSS